MVGKRESVHPTLWGILNSLLLHLTINVGHPLKRSIPIEHFTDVFVIIPTPGEIQSITHLKLKEMTEEERQRHIKIRRLWGSQLNSSYLIIIFYFTRN